MVKGLRRIAGRFPGFTARSRNRSSAAVGIVTQIEFGPPLRKSATRLIEAVIFPPPIINREPDKGPWDFDRLMFTLYPSAKLRGAGRYFRPWMRSPELAQMGLPEKYSLGFQLSRKARL
jgi:hypothetical protein